MTGIRKKCCNLCPYSRKNTLFLHPNRAEDFAHNASNPYTDFVCHKTGESVEDIDGSTIIVRGEKSLTCAGFHVLQSESNGKTSEIPVDIKTHFFDPEEMIYHHEEKYFETENS